MKNQQLVTIYSAGVFGVNKSVGKVIDFGTRKCAQYSAAAFINFVPKGKRSPRAFVVGYKPYFLIIDGENHPEPDDIFGEAKISEDGLLITRITKYSSYDDERLTDFDQKIGEYLKDKVVLMDIRHTVQTNIINK